MDFSLQRPEHLPDDVWRAIEQHWSRLEVALSTGDRPFQLGSAKELVECIARSVLEAKAVVTPSNADYDDVVNRAHVVLERQAGRDIVMSKDVRVIAGSTKKMVLAIRSVRNDFGTGHGRARVDPVKEEMATVVVDAAIVWCRWALRRLSHVLLRAPESLISMLETDVLSLQSLHGHVEMLELRDQPADVQRSLGAAFARRAESGTFVARIVGIDEPTASNDLKAWPADYRFGVAEGFVFDRNGFVDWLPGWVASVVGILAPVPPAQLKTFLLQLAEQITRAGFGPNLQDPAIVAFLTTTMRELAPEIAADAAAAWESLISELSPPRS